VEDGIVGIISDSGPGCGAVPEPGARSRSPAHSLGALGASGATWVEPPGARARPQHTGSQYPQPFLGRQQGRAASAHREPV